MTQTLSLPSHYPALADVFGRAAEAEATIERLAAEEAAAQERLAGLRTEIAELGRRAADLHDSIDVDRERLLLVAYAACAAAAPDDEGYVARWLRRRGWAQTTLGVGGGTWRSPAGAMIPMKPAIQQQLAADVRPVADAARRWARGETT